MPQSLREKVYDNIKKDILNGEIRTTDILTEKEMIRRFNVSKSPVRDAFIELCNDEILESIPRLGYRIVEYSTEYLDSIVAFRHEMEPLYLEKYFHRITDGNIEILSELHHKYDNQDKSIVANYWASNQEFHLKLASFYKDPFFYEVLQNAMNKQMIVFSQYYWNHWDRSVFNIYHHQHDKLLVLLRKRDLPQIKKELQKDISSFMQV
ncbi:MAG: GntR family transcriptional regulator [Tissierellia bacterium]|nr:GntR family transcriptional regulator [Tissierellia bacterium]